jgi:hypothetical protein
MKHSLLYFDIETVPDESRSNLCQSKKDELVSDKKDFIPSRWPEFCKIVALGWAYDDSPPQSLVVGIPHKNTKDVFMDITEKVLLEHFWKLVAKNTPVLVGFNILNFDLPVIFVRSALLSIKPTKLIDRKSWRNDCIDLLEARRYTNGGGKLKELARYFSFDVPAEDIDGSQVEKIYIENPPQLAKYVESDIVVTRQLYHFYKGFFVEDYTN